MLIHVMSLGHDMLNGTDIAVNKFVAPNYLIVDTERCSIAML
jgi:hypothetical protein